MNAIRLKVRRTGSISRKHLTEVFLRNRRATRARIDVGALYPARIKLRCNKKHFLPELLLHKNLRTIRSGYGLNMSRFDRVHIMQVHCRGDALHLRHTLKTCEYLPGRIVILRSLHCVPLAFVRVNLSFHPQSFGSKPMNLSSVNSQRKIKDKLF